MKVKIETWTSRGVDQDDIQEWSKMGLIWVADSGNLIWTIKSPSKWPSEAKERYYATAGRVAKETGERIKAWNAERKAEWAKIVAQYGEGVRQIHHTCQQEPYVTTTAYVTAHSQAFNMDGTPHFCERYLEPIAQSPADVEPKTDEYTYCSKCNRECGWTASTLYEDLGFCPVCGMDCILPPGHPIRVEFRAWAEKFVETPPSTEGGEAPFLTVAGLNWTNLYFDTKAGAEAYCERSPYRTLSPMMHQGIHDRAFCYEVAEHYYEKKGVK